MRVCNTSDSVQETEMDSVGEVRVKDNAIENNYDSSANKQFLYEEAARPNWSNI